MSLVAWYVVLGAVQVALALWVILAQPRRVVNWAVGALLFLWAGSGIVFQLYREAATVAQQGALRRVGDLYEAPAFLLILFIVDHLLFATARRPRPWRVFLGASGAALAFLMWATLGPVDPATRTSIVLAGYLMSQLAQIAAVIVACVAANDARRSVLERRRAALLGVAFALLIGHASIAGVLQLVSGGGRPAGQEILFPNAVLGLVVALYAIARLPAPFRGAGARAGVRATIALALVVGLLTYTTLLLVRIVAGRAVVLSAFALVLAVAVLRYDLGAARVTQRRRLDALATGLLGFSIVAIVGVAAWSLAGEGVLIATIALAAVAVPVALVATPLRRLPAWVTRLVVLDPRDPEALRERVRVYAKTLHAAMGPEGRLAPATEPALAALRAQLGLSQRDHDLLVAMGDASGADGLVAYRLALVGAGGDGALLDEAELSRLRDEFRVSDRDHALVLAHVGATSESLAPGALFLGRYHILHRLGNGLSEVWLARDVRSGDAEVVVKRLLGHDARDGSALKMMHKEARIASLLEHSHIVSVREVELVGDETYLVMEHMRGGSLADALRRAPGGRWPEDEVVRVALDVLDALAALHARGIVHRDVKPANILLDERGGAKLGDFNVARELVSGETLGGAGGARGPVGTFAYMPPEQARGFAVRPSSDLYALAASMFEAIAGAPYLDLVGLSHTEAVARIAAQAPPATVPGVSPRVSAAIVRALARAPEDRFGSAAEMRAALVTPAGTREGSDPRR